MAVLPYLQIGAELSATNINAAIRQLLIASGLNPDASFPGFITTAPSFVYNVNDYGAIVGASTAATKSGIMSAIQAAIDAGGGTVYFPPRDFDIGNLSNSETVFAITAAHDLRFSGYGARIVCNTITAADSQPKLFLFRNCQRIYAEGLRMIDNGADISVAWRGAIMFLIRAADANTYRGFGFRDCGSEKGVSFLTTTGYDGGATPVAGAFLKDITVDSCFAQDTYYGINCQDAGSNLRARNFRCHNVKRGYFPYGVENHDVDITMTADGGFVGNNCVLIKHYYYNVRAIRVRLNVLNAYSADSGVEFQQQPTSGGNAYVDDVEVDFHFDTNGAKTFTNGPVFFDSFVNGTPPVEETTTTANRWDRIRLSGNFGNATADPKIKFGSTNALKQATEGRMYLDASLYQTLHAHKPHFPGFVVRLAHDREFRTLAGDLTTAQKIVIPCAGFDGGAFGFIVRIYATDYSALGTNHTMREDHVLAYNQTAGNVAIISTNNLYNRVAGTGIVPVFTANGENIDVTFTGAPYNAAASFLKLEIQWANGPRGPV